MASTQNKLRLSNQKENTTYCFLFLRVLRCFTSPGTLPSYEGSLLEAEGFPHSDILGSQVVWHLTETYRSQTTSFIASKSQGIRRTPFIPVRNAENRFSVFVLFLYRELRQKILAGRGACLGPQSKKNPLCNGTWLCVWHRADMET